MQQTKQQIKQISVLKLLKFKVFPHTFVLLFVKSFNA